MNKYDERYEIRLANQNDIDSIMEFIDKHWKKNHILSKDKELFKYEYLDDNCVNFVLAIDKAKASIEGILGFIRSSKTSDPNKKDIWGSMWKVKDEKNNLPLLGVELAKRIYNLTNCRTYISSGTNPKTAVPIRKLIFGDSIGKMNHYYYLNPFIDEYKIAVVKENKFNNDEIKSNNKLNTKIRQFKSINEVNKYFSIEDIDSIPYKDSWYFNKRYFNHPYYDYLVYGLEYKNQNIEALLVAREVAANGRKILRIVDFIGNQESFSGLENEIYKLFVEREYEYIDFYTHGFDEEMILKSGFRLRDEEDLNIIPNYFEPFLQENIDLWVHYEFKNTLFFKADGDQDRPNEMRI